MPHAAIYAHDQHRNEPRPNSIYSYSYFRDRIKCVKRFQNWLHLFIHSTSSFTIYLFFFMITGYYSVPVACGAKNSEVAAGGAGPKSAPPPARLFTSGRFDILIYFWYVYKSVYKKFDIVDITKLLYTHSRLQQYTVMSQVISFRASGHFLNWIESQRTEGESLNQCCQRMLKDMSVDTSTELSTKMSTKESHSLASTELSTLSTALSTRNNDSVVSTNIVDIVDKAVSSSLDPVIERIAAIEERLEKLQA